MQNKFKTAQVCQGSRWLLNSRDLPKESVNSNITWLNSRLLFSQISVFTCNVAERERGRGELPLDIFPSREINKVWIKTQCQGMG